MVTVLGGERVRVGDSALPFCLRDAEGHIHRLSDYQGAWLFLVFHRHLR